MRIVPRNLPLVSVEEIQSEIETMAHASTLAERQGSAPAAATSANEIPASNAVQSPNNHYAESEIPPGITPGIADVRALMKLDSVQFLHGAYHSVLAREMDADGEDVYKTFLWNGMHRGEIILRIRFSREGRRIHAKLHNGFLTWVDLLLWRFPLLGYFYRIVRELVRLPGTMRRLEMNQAELRRKMDRNGRG